MINAIKAVKSHHIGACETNTDRIQNRNEQKANLVLSICNGTGEVNFVIIEIELDL